MSFSEWIAWLYPDWLRDWITFELLPKLGLNPRHMLLSGLRGIADTVLLLMLGLGVWRGSAQLMGQRYALSPEIQAATLTWAPVADRIAREIDIPREVPLVLWFKENSMQANNPDLCTGIIGAYDLVQSGQHPCFEPGPIGDLEVVRQLRIGAQEYKKRCPEVTYLAQDAELLKRCYFAYNAGVSAAASGNPDRSAYVMNGFSTEYTGMVYQDVVLGTVVVEQLGAWPVHLAMQGLIVSQLDEEERPLTNATLDLITRGYDWLAFQIQGTSSRHGTVRMSLPFQRSSFDTGCLARPNGSLRFDLRPSLNPVSEAPILTQDVHGCSYALPGIDISSNNRSALLVAPMPGRLTTYTDQWQNTTIRIENSEWVVWMLHPRSYLLEEGYVQMGEAVGVMGAVGIATGPHVHYTIYDKVNKTFVDPAGFLP